MRLIRFAGEGCAISLALPAPPISFAICSRMVASTRPHWKKKPLTLPEDGSVLDLVERLRDARVPMAIVNDGGGEIKGVVTSTDLLETSRLGNRTEPT